MGDLRVCSFFPLLLTPMGVGVPHLGPFPALVLCDSQPVDPDFVLRCPVLGVCGGGLVGPWARPRQCLLLLSSKLGYTEWRGPLCTPLTHSPIPQVSFPRWLWQRKRQRWPQRCPLKKRWTWSRSPCCPLRRHPHPRFPQVGLGMHWILGKGCVCVSGEGCVSPSPPFRSPRSPRHLACPPPRPLA